MPKIVRIKIGSNPKKPVAVISVRGRSKKHAVANANRVLRKHFKNVTAGFYRGGVFHPIRASEDYRPSRAGERSTSYGKKSLSAKQEKRFRKGQKVGQYF